MKGLGEFGRVATSQGDGFKWGRRNIEEFESFLTTYLPVKPEAPKMMRSKAVLGLSFGIADIAGE